MPAFLAMVPRWGWYVLGGIIGLFLVHMAINSVKQKAFAAGEASADAKWQEAERRLLKQAAEAGSEADKKAAARAVEFTAKVTEEKERLDAAKAQGSSPMDVLFGS